MIKINEIFGPTVQGEGAAEGRHCMFVRVADCNLQCTWCDTAYTWAFNQRLADKLEIPVSEQLPGHTFFPKEDNYFELTPEQIMGYLTTSHPTNPRLRGNWDIYHKPTMIVISGGEPLMQSRALAPLAAKLARYNNMIHVETAATLIPTGDFDRHVTQYNVSPKLAHSGNRLALRRKEDVLQWFGEDDRAWFKFVVRELSDLDEVDEIVKIAGVEPHRVMVMPEGVTAQKNLEIAQKFMKGNEVVDRGYGISFRTHILLWKDVRGK